jgi:hypothetical protein
MSSRDELKVYIADMTESIGDCWIWTGYCDRKGYGISSMKLVGSQRRMHRVSWAVHNDWDIIFDGHIHHRCGNKSCVNPEHLEWCEDNKAHQKIHREERVEETEFETRFQPTSSGEQLQVKKICTVCGGDSWHFVFNIKKGRSAAFCSPECWKVVRQGVTSSEFSQKAKEMDLEVNGDFNDRVRSDFN